MSTRNYDGWRRYGKWIKENHKNYQKQKQMQKLEQLPDPEKHQRLSFIKSGIRIAGYVCLPFSIITATILLVASEVVGILEELV
jgi:hypothetical protein